MSQILFDSVSFHYDRPFAQVFRDLNLSIDISWRAGLIAPNGCGKTTLFRLVSGNLTPCRGRITSPVTAAYFPYKPPDDSLLTIDVVKDAIAPYRRWRARIHTLSGSATSHDLTELGELMELFELHGGYEIEAHILREFDAVGIGSPMAHRPFRTLSSGEQTRALIAALFLRRAPFPLVDEPTNHLDLEGRSLLGRYLSTKQRFIVASHDRAFLDQCIDHVITIEKNEVDVLKGNYTTWRRWKDVQEEQERLRTEQLKREVDALRRAAGQRRQWSDAKEREKIGAGDKGFVGHRAAKQMKRALHIERRIQERVDEKEQLLRKTRRKRSDLKLTAARGSPEIIISAHDLTVDLSGRTILHRTSFTLERGERLAIMGPNGSGKTTLLRVICGDISPTTGTVVFPKYLTGGRAYQIPLWEKGILRAHLREHDIDETSFRNVMAAFGISGEIFDRPLQTFSQGERKKVDLCRSFLTPCHLLIWDEPMNYVDLFARAGIEDVLLKHNPTMLFVEHDRWFIDRVATSVLKLA